MNRFTFTRSSANSKTGPIPVTSSDMGTCPSNCSLKGNGCYASYGMVGMHWRKLNKPDHGLSFDALVENIAKLPKGQLWRHNVAGDLPMIEGSQCIDSILLGQLIAANKGKQGFTYTHHSVLANDLDSSNNRLTIQWANQQGFTINLSADSMQDADKLKALSIGPVVCIMPIDCDKVTKTPDGNTVVQCPATYRDDIQCTNCGICAEPNRKAIIGFPVHGSGKNKAQKVISIRSAN